MLEFLRFCEDGYNNVRIKHTKHTKSGWS